MAFFECDVVAKNRVLFTGKLDSLVVPGVAGDLGIMTNHEPFMTVLKDGFIWGRKASEEDDSEKSDAVLCAANLGGYVQALRGRVIVICDKTRFIDEIDLSILEKEIPEIEAQLALINEQDNFISYSVLSRKLHWLKVQRDAKLSFERIHGNS